MTNHSFVKWLNLLLAYSGKHTQTKTGVVSKSRRANFSFGPLNIMESCERAIVAVFTGWETFGPFQRASFQKHQVNSIMRATYP